MILETERLYLREMKQSDFDSLCKILQDEDTMYAYEGAFNDDEVQEWLNRQIFRYQKWNFGLWAVILKETDEMIGQCGLTMQPWKDAEVLEIGYLFERLYWHNGYAIEVAKACKKYAFEMLKADEVCSIIRDTNIASQNVAIRNGMISSCSENRSGCTKKREAGIFERHISSQKPSLVPRRKLWPLSLRRKGQNTLQVHEWEEYTPPDFPLGMEYSSIPLQEVLLLGQPSGSGRLLSPEGRPCCLLWRKIRSCQEIQKSGQGVSTIKGQVHRN